MIMTKEAFTHFFINTNMIKFNILLYRKMDNKVVHSDTLKLLWLFIFRNISFSTWQLRMNKKKWISNKPILLSIKIDKKNFSMAKCAFCNPLNKEICICICVHIICICICILCMLWNEIFLLPEKYLCTSFSHIYFTSQCPNSLNGFFSIF